MNKAELRVTIPFLPPSSNNVYKNIPGHGRKLSTQAQQFKLRAMRILQQGGRASLLKMEQNVPYQLHLIFYFEEVENKGWYERWTRGDHAGQRKAETRYKRMDLSNRIKLLEDTVASAVGIDDCHTFRMIIDKEHDRKNPRVEVCLSSMPEKGEQEDASRTRSEKTEHDRTGKTLPGQRVSTRESGKQKGDAGSVPFWERLRRHSRS
jgi:Holliday junction resolvase RusA-like endonuclease